MNYLKLFVTFVVLISVVTTFALAGSEKNVAPTFTPSVAKDQIKILSAAEKQQLKSTLRNSTTILEPSKDGSDVPEQFKYKSNGSFRTTKSQMIATSSPVPQKQAWSGGPLSGTYHIPGDFPSISAAVAVLNYAGASGNVDFKLDAASYTEPCPITFGNYTGADTYSVTVEPNSAAVAIHFVATASEGKGFAFNGAQNVTVTGGTYGMSMDYSSASVFPLSDAFGSTVYITGGSYNIEVSHASVQGIVNNAVWANQTEGRSAIFIFWGKHDTFINETINFDDLTITNATYGIKCLPETLHVSVVDLTVKNSKIGGAYGNPVCIGGFFEYPAIVTYENNVIDGSTFLDNYWNNPYTEYDVDVAFGVGPIFYNLGQSTGTHLISADACVFDHNIIRNVYSPGEGILAYGARVSQGNDGLNIPAVCTNNIIYGITNACGTNTEQVTGLRGTAGYCYQNSIRLTGTITGSSVVARCINGVTAAYNNAFSNEVTGGSAANRAAIVAGGTYDYNAAYSNGVFVSGGSASQPYQSAVTSGTNTHGTWGPIGFNSDLTITTGPSVAEDAGTHSLPVTVDFNGNPVDTSDHPDCGAYQFTTGTPYGQDVVTGTFLSPGATAVVGVPSVVKVRVYNNSITSVGSFPVEVKFPNESYDVTYTVTGLNRQSYLDTVFTPWTPASIVAQTATATSTLAGDVNTANDQASLSNTAANPTVLAANTQYDWNSGAQGWTATTQLSPAKTDWVRSNSFTKLGGPYNGYSWVTAAPNHAGTYTQGYYATKDGYAAAYPGPNLLLSPWLNVSALSGGGDLYVSFLQSIATEPGWDGSWVEYTTDGVTWHHLGQVNDPNGTNWYSTAVYANGQSFTGDPPDTNTMKTYGLYGPGTGMPNNTYLPMGWWTSNGDPGPNATTGTETGTPEGPFGYVFAQLHLTPATYPDIFANSGHVRFRYVAYSDALSPPSTGTSSGYAENDLEAGWAVDNFAIGSTGAVFTGGHITGTVYHDLDGNGANAAPDTVLPGIKLQVTYFGVVVDTITTDGSGAYDFNLSANSSLPGLYTLTVVTPGYSASQPFGVKATHDFNHPSGGGTMSQDFGLYIGGVSGKVYEDKNNDGTDNGGTDPGLLGWTVEVHKDSVRGALMGSSTSNASGNWSVSVPPGSYYAKLVRNSAGRRTEPAADSSIAFSVSGNSGSGTALVTGVKFGAFVFGTLNYFGVVDLDGFNHSGTATIPTGTTIWYTLKKGTTRLDSNTVGNGLLSNTYSGLDAGTYVFTQLAEPSGWIRTDAGGMSDTIIIATSNQNTSDTTFQFKLATLSGKAFVDANGDSTTTGDLPAVGRSINVSGTLYSANPATTDSTGAYSFVLGPGAHTVSQTLPAGWIQITAKPAITYSFTTFSASAPNQNKTNINFLSFKTDTVQGVVFRDYNDDGSMNGPDAGVGGISVSLTGAGATTTASDGSFMFTGVSNGAKTLSVTVPAGFTVSTSGGASLHFTTASGTNVTGNVFGLFQTSDGTKKYRTFTADSLAKWATKKSVARPKTGAAFPNIQNMYDEIYQQAKDSMMASGIMVGKSGQKLNPADPKSKEKGYLVPSKGADINATLYKKGKTGPLYQSGAAHGIDFFVGNAARIIKVQKNLTPDKFSDVLLGNMLALSVNLAASDWGKTPAGLGDLIYYGGGTYNNMTVTQIYAAGNDMMTNWEYVTAAQFSALNSVVAAINAEFSGPLDTASSWTATSKLVWKGVKTAAASSILKANPVSSPVTHQPAPPSSGEPETFSLSQNYPNPFNPTTTIGFSVPNDAVVSITVFNVLGQEVTKVLDNESYFAGSYSVTFNANNYTSGVYFYRVNADVTTENGTVQHMTQTKKMILAK